MSSSKLIVHRAFFCDDLSEGLFGKVNITGYIGTSIAIDTSPYVLHSNAVLECTIPTGFPSTELELQVAMLDGSGATVDLGLAKLHVPATSQEAKRFLQGKIRQKIVYGRIKINLLSGAEVLFSQEFDVINGKSPNVEVNGDIESSAIVSHDSKYDLEIILKSASRELILIDQYLTPDSLLSFLPFVPAKAKVSILVSPEQKNEYAKSIAKIRGVGPAIDIRFNKSFHDRFIMVNGSEFFHSGQSLKDLGGRVSRISKITKKTEMDNLLKKFQEEWTKATTL